MSNKIKNYGLQTNFSPEISPAREIKQYSLTVGIQPDGDKLSILVSLTTYPAEISEPAKRGISFCSRFIKLQCIQCLGVDILIRLSTQSCILCVIRISRLLSRECCEDPQIWKEVLSIRILIRLERLENLMIYENMGLKPLQYSFTKLQDISFAPINIQKSNFLKFKEGRMLIPESSSQHSAQSS